MGKNITEENNFFGFEKISKILLKIAPPVMLAQLIQALYNIVDSFFVGKYSDNALTALSVVYPVQLIIVALSVGMGVGVNTYMARKFAHDKDDEANYTAGAGMILAVIGWFVFAVVAYFIMTPYVNISAKSPDAINDAIVYGKIVCVGSIGAFLEGNWSKVHQAQGNMKLPMIAQIVGAATNIILDPIFIFGAGIIPEMGVAGAAYATICGQMVAAIITGIKGYRMPPKIRDMLHYIKKIYFYGYPSILMQALFTIYIIALNLILAGFSDSAVTVLGLYYKMQSFFFIPLLGLQTCIVPLLSYNYAKGNFERCRETRKDAFIISASFMIIGIIMFVFFPKEVTGIFSSSNEVFEIGEIAFPIIGTCFFPAIFSLIMPVFFQAIGYGKTSLLLSLIRQIFCLIPIFWGLSLIGLDYSWLAFPISETIAGGIGLLLYTYLLHTWKLKFFGFKK